MIDLGSVSGACNTMWHVMSQTFTLRMKPNTRQALERQAERTRIPKTALAERYVEEGLRMDLHPGVVFRDGPAGRRAGLAGGPDVWQVIEVFVAEGRSVEGTADNIELPTRLVHAAVGYYADFREEIEARIESNRRAAEEAEAAWRRRQALTSG